MSCRFDRELLSLYADGILKRDRVSYVEIHLSECNQCQQVLEITRGIGKALTSLPREEASPELIERILVQAGRRSSWVTTRRILGVIWAAGTSNFEIDDEVAESLRGELPEWVVKWILFV